MSFSLAQAQLYRLINGAHHLQVLNQRDLGQDRYLLTIAGEWLGRYQIRAYLIQRHAGQWLTVEIPGEWIDETARLLRPLLPEKREEV